MGKFEDDLKIYYDKLRENIELIRKIAENQMNEEAIRILLTPENEKELLAANATLTFFIDSLAITENVMYNNVQNIDLEKNTAIEFFVKLINASKNKNDDLISETLNTMDAETNAKLMYDFFIGFVGNPEEAIIMIAEKTGFNTDDELSLMQFQVYLSRVSELTKNKTTYEFEVTDILLGDEEKLNEFINTTKHFHKLFIDGLNGEPKVSKSFVRTLEITTKKK